jgi:hypothetical protein
VERQCSCRIDRHGGGGVSGFGTLRLLGCRLDIEQLIVRVDEQRGIGQQVVTKLTR